jgi:hypothetical protein
MRPEWVATRPSPLRIDRQKAVSEIPIPDLRRAAWRWQGDLAFLLSNHAQQGERAMARHEVEATPIERVPELLSDLTLAIDVSAM